MLPHVHRHRHRHGSSLHRMLAADNKIADFVVEQNMDNLRQRLRRQNRKIDGMMMENVGRHQLLNEANAVSADNMRKVMLLVQNSSSVEEIVDILEVLSLPPPDNLLFGKMGPQTVQSLFPTKGLYPGPGDVNHILYKMMLKKLERLYGTKTPEPSCEFVIPKPKRKTIKKEESETEEIESTKQNSEPEPQSTVKSIPPAEPEPTPKTTKIPRRTDDQNPFLNPVLPSQRNQQLEAKNNKLYKEGALDKSKFSKNLRRFRAAVRVVTFCQNFEKLVKINLLIRYTNVLNLVNKTPATVQTFINAEVSKAFNSILKQAIFSNSSKNGSFSITESSFTEAVGQFAKGFKTLANSLADPAHKRAVLYILHTHFPGGMIAPKLFCDFELNRLSYSKRRFIKFGKDQSLQVNMVLVFTFFMRSFLRDFLLKEHLDKRVALFIARIIACYTIYYFDLNLQVQKNSVGSDSSGITLLTWPTEPANLAQPTVEIEPFDIKSASAYSVYTKSDNPINNLTPSAFEIKVLRARTLMQKTFTAFLVPFQEIKALFLKFFIESKLLYLAKKQKDMDTLHKRFAMEQLKSAVKKELEKKLSNIKSLGKAF